MHVGVQGVNIDKIKQCYLLLHAILSAVKIYSGSFICVINIFVLKHIVCLDSTCMRSVISLEILDNSILFITEYLVKCFAH